MERIIMGSLNIENFHAKKERAMIELTKGKETAIHLQTLLRKPVQDQGLVSTHELALQIFRSFSDTLSQFSSAQIAAVDCPGESKKKPGVRDRRGCYKRRKSLDSRVTVSPTAGDGHAWRKYGQKNIQNSEFPRSYFRCAYNQEGCKATKQVQLIKGDSPTLYQTTYFHHHTCTPTRGSPHIIIMGSDPVERNLIKFETDIRSQLDQASESLMTGSSVQQEDTRSEDVSAGDHDEAGVAMDDTWQDIVGLEPLGYKPEWTPYQQEMFSDMDNFPLF